MCAMQVVFLFDLNMCTDFLLKPKEEFNKKLLSIRLACVRLLTDFSTKSPNFRWGFKFFDSSGSITQTMPKFSFSDMSLEAFETLENEICVRYERHIALLQALAESSQNSLPPPNDLCKIEIPTAYPLNILQFALTQILCEFQWESMDMWSPSTKKIKDKTLSMGKRNFLFLFRDFKDNDETLFKFFGIESLSSKHKFMNIFLPQALRKSLLQKADIHLVFLNTCQDQKFMGTLSSSTLPLLSEALHSIQGSMIPLTLLSQPLYSMHFLNNSEKILQQRELPVVSNLYSSYHSSLMPFSSLFQQSLCHLFYSNENSVTCECYINFINKDIKIPVQVINILNKKDNFYEDVKNIKVQNSVKNKYSPYKGVKWSKFVIHYAVSKSAHYPTYGMLLCLTSDSRSDASEVDFMRFNKNVCLEGVSLVLECITDCGLKMPGLLTPLSCEAAIISILNPSINHLFLESYCKNSTVSSLNAEFTTLVNNSSKIQIKTELKNYSDDVKFTENLEESILKPFQMECMESWFKPNSSVSKLSSYIQSKSLNKTSKIESFYKLLHLSARNSKKFSAKSSKKPYTSTHESEANSMDNIGEKLPDSMASFESGNKDIGETSDLCYQELLSVIKDAYESAVEISGNIVTTSKRIVNLMTNFYKKNSSTCVEEDVQKLFTDNFMMTARSISEKYEMFDTEEATMKKVKECQIQVLLVLEIENFKLCPDRSSCVSIVTSLLRLMTFYSGLKELQNFLSDVLTKNYNHHLNDILVEIGDELNVSIFEDTESINSPTDTVSSELINEEELFSSVISSNVSEKSSPGICSRKDKENNTMERKLLRHRSDISDTSLRYRQVLLPRSSIQKKKGKTAASKAVRSSPRIASKKKEWRTRSVNEKPRTVRRNLFPGEKSSQTPKKNKNNLHSTPRSSKRSHVSNSKYVAETPSHKQNHSALQRRKSFMDKLSDSPKVIAESPQIVRTAKNGAYKELFKKLQRARSHPSKPTNVPLNQVSNGTQKSQVPSGSSFNLYTPESKKRLSLKLFSKLLSSPTARMGIKKCTKRLFSQISPNKDNESNKRVKHNNEFEQTSNSVQERKNII